MMNNKPKIIKVNPLNILPINESWAATAGFSTSPDYGNPAFSYEIKPLSFTLCLKGNDPELLDKNKSFKFFVGDHVSGYCPYDGKKHEGMIKYFYWVPGSDGTMPKFVYIQDFSNEDTIPLEAESIKPTLTKYTPNDLADKDYYRARDTEIAHDYGATEMPKTVFEGKNFDFNNLNEEKQLTNKEKQTIKYLLGESLEENENKSAFVLRLKTIAKKGLLTTAIVMALIPKLNAQQYQQVLTICNLYNIEICDLNKTPETIQVEGVSPNLHLALNIAHANAAKYPNYKIKETKKYYNSNNKTYKYVLTLEKTIFNLVTPPPLTEKFDFNSNEKTLNEQYAHLNEAKVMAKKFFEDNFDLKPAKGFSFKQYVDKSTGAYVTTEPFDGKPTGTMKFFAKHGISKVYNGSIGFSEKEQKWYGWSHRAIYGFGVGSKVKKGDCGYKGKAWTAKTLDDAKQMAKDFADAVS